MFIYLTLCVDICSSNIVTFSVFLCSWFHGKITRQQAEELLSSSFEDGVFLVRESVTYPGDYTLCVACQQTVEHYRIIYQRNRLTIDEDTFFENLAHLIQVVTAKYAKQLLVSYSYFCPYIFIQISVSSMPCFLMEFIYPSSVFPPSVAFVKSCVYIIC